MERIGFGKRAGAAVMDMVLLMVIGSTIIWIFGLEVDQAALATDPAAAARARTGSLVSLVLVCGYSLIEAFTGQSPGKMMLKIIIRNPDGSPANIKTLLYRYALKNSSTLFLLIAGITSLRLMVHLSSIAGLVIVVGFFFVLRASRQAFHDMIAKTAVFDKV